MSREVISTEHAPAAIGPYSQAIKATGPLLFISGQIPLAPDGKMVTGDVRDQAKQCLENIVAILAQAGLDTSNVVKTTILLSSMEHFVAVNEVYLGYFKLEPPARATYAVAGLPRGVDIEIEAVAVFPS